ncbi:N-acetylmuramoyl-L-alanine amidase [Streptomyces sp. NPDC006879]|uniref:peptidoglycan recognition protein family protein n=1 Tax=Streptomyces sp. NPDC006879 TaxID=3364767 RepID=UPI0036C29064
MRKIWVTAAAVTAGVTGVFALQGVAGSGSFLDGGPTRTSSGSAGSASPNRPVKTALRTAALKVSEDHPEANYRDDDTKPFSMLAVSWDEYRAKVNGSIQVRTKSRKSGQWSRWLTLESSGEAASDGPRPGLRGASEPAWVGPSNGIEVRVSGQGSALPAGMRLDMVDPGTSQVISAKPAAFALPAASSEPSQPTTVTEDPAAPTPEAPEPSPEVATATPTPDAGTPTSDATTPTPEVSEPAPTPEPPTAAPSPSPTTTAGPVSGVPRPSIVSRSQWGADESMNDEDPVYGQEVKAVFVHHTAQTNAYSCADSAAIMRGLHTLHVKSNGWKDLGYNFIVDKCGTVFEGRKGGVDRPVTAAHTLGFNTDTTGIAVIGSYTTEDAEAVAKQAVAHVAAWKLGQYKYDPEGSTTLTAGLSNGKFSNGQSAVFKRISGHRDGFATECPGTVLYGQLPAIRTMAGGAVNGLIVSSVQGAGKSGTTYYTKGKITVSWSTTTPAALIKGYELLVDGVKVAEAGAGAASAQTTLDLGSHKVEVRATSQSGESVRSPAVTVIAETNPPEFTSKPSLELRTGTVETTAVPVRLRWKATDAEALRQVRLTSPLVKYYAPTTTSASHTAASAKSTRWYMRAYDQAGNYSPSSSVAGTPVIVQESSAVKSGSWSTRSNSSYLGGKSYSSSSKGASLTYTFTGRSVALVFSRASDSGQVDVYFDGVKTKTVDLKSSTVKYRYAFYSKTWSSSASHTVKVVVTGTSGRPTITTDGIVYLK